MKKRRLGKTELLVSPIGYGALPGITPETLLMGIRGGMNFIDTARAYGDSEMKIGKMLKELGDRSRLIISTKSGSRTLDGFRSDLTTSLEVLGTDFIDIMFLHDVSTEENWRLVQNNGLIDELYRLKEEGKIRHLGISTHDKGDIATEMMKSGHFEVVMLAHNAANPEAAETHIPLAKSLDLGIIIMKPYGGGVLTEKRSREMGFSITAEDALKWVISNKDISVAIPGMDATEYVELALDVLNSDFDSFSDEEIKSISGNVSIKGREYCRGCGYCLPCPQEIPLTEVLALNNRWEVYYQADWAQMHQISDEFNKRIPADKGPERCTKCGICQQKCPYDLPIPELMENCVKIKQYINPA